MRVAIKSTRKRWTVRLGRCLAMISLIHLGSANALTTSGTSFTVSLPIVAGCTISSPSGTVSFASASTAAPADVTSSMSVTCTNTTPYNTYFTSANTVTGNTTRTLRGTGGNLATVSYQILSGATAIGNTNLTGLAGTGTGSATVTTLTFRITSAWALIKPDTYSDVVTMNVDF